MAAFLTRRTLVLGLALALSAGGPARADDRHRDDRHDHDHDLARRALERGEAKPLTEILGRVRDRLGGEVVGVSFDREGGRYIYEFKVITPKGRLREVQVDALTAKILSSEESR